MNNDPSNRFNRFELPSDIDITEQVSPIVLAYLQNKIADYASALVEKQLPYSPNPMEQVTAILAHERLRNFVEAYEELLSELTPTN